MPIRVLWGKLGVIEMMFKPLRDWREVARGVRGRVLDYGHLLPEEALEAKLRDLRRFLARV
jgi:haloacetate dehalogenase